MIPRLGRLTATLSMSLASLVAFAMTGLIAVHSSPGEFDSIDLVTAGAASADLVRDGGYWRLATAPFLHASWMHLATNLIGLVSAGAMLETRTGTVWTLRVAALSVITQSQFSIWSNPPSAITVGASGVVCALMTALLATSVTETRGRRRAIEIALLAGSLGIACLPWGNAPPGVDISAHLGGFITGLCYGFAGYVIRRSDGEARERTAPLQAGALVIVLAFAGAWSAAGLQGRIADATAYAPRIEIQAATDRTRMKALAEHYPSDPRLGLALAGYDIGDGAYGTARLRLAAVLAERRPMSPLGVDLPIRALVLLSYAALLDGDRQGAERAASLVCPLGADDRWTSDVALVRWIADLRAKGLCPKTEPAKT